MSDLPYRCGGCGARFPGLASLRYLGLEGFRCPDCEWVAESNGWVDHDVLESPTDDAQRGLDALFPDREADSEDSEDGSADDNSTDDTDDSDSGLDIPDWVNEKHHRVWRIVDKDPSRSAKDIASEFDDVPKDTARDVRRWYEMYHLGDVDAVHERFDAIRSLKTSALIRAMVLYPERSTADIASQTEVSVKSVYNVKYRYRPLIHNLRTVGLPESPTDHDVETVSESRYPLNVSEAPWTESLVAVIRAYLANIERYDGRNRDHIEIDLAVRCDLSRASARRALRAYRYSTIEPESDAIKPAYDELSAKEQEFVIEAAQPSVTEDDLLARVEYSDNGARSAWTYLFGLVEAIAPTIEVDSESVRDSTDHKTADDDGDGRRSVSVDRSAWVRTGSTTETDDQELKDDPSANSWDEAAEYVSEPDGSVAPVREPDSDTKRPAAASADVGWTWVAVVSAVVGALTAFVATHIGAIMQFIQAVVA